MSNGVKASNASLISSRRRQSIGLAIGRFVRLLSGNRKDDPTSPESMDLFGSAYAEDADEVAREVYPRICAMPDDCKWPQEKLFDFTRQVAARRERSVSNPTAEPLAAADRQKRLQSAMQTLDSEARKVMALHVEGGKHFREIAQLLDLPEPRVLEILRLSYSTLRTRALPTRLTVVPAAPSRESNSEV